jgi:carbamoyltransferase
MHHICGHFATVTGSRRLALAGGVALNCTANGHLMRSGIFDEIYIQPAAGDDGSALGAALYRAAQAGEIHNVRFPTPFLGPEYSRDSVAHAIAGFEERIDIHECADFAQTCRVAAQQIADGKVIAWCRGRLEFGPRALGHRSILADPGVADMRDRINAMVKMREAFRPFAPAVTREQVHQWFDVAPGTHLPYMITTVDVRSGYREHLPAITHVNGSARVQTVSADDNADFHALLRAVGKTTGREMVLNTSFNIKGQPMVNTPAEAVTTFLGTGIDSLFLGEFVLARRRPATERDRQRLGELVGAQRA